MKVEVMYVTLQQQRKDYDDTRYHDQCSIGQNRIIALVGLISKKCEAIFILLCL